MNIDFVFSDYIRKIRNKKITFKGDLKTIRGLSISAVDKILVHLGAEQWKELFQIGERCLFYGLSNTLVHENIHLEIDKTDVIEPFTAEGEEKVCQLLAGQLLR